MKREVNELINLLFATKKLVSERMRESHGVNRISIVKLKTLYFIDEKKPTMREIADYLGITPPSATVLVRYFSRNGLTKKAYDKADGRIIRLEITSKGKDYLKATSAEFADKMGSVLSKLNRKQINNLKEILETLSKSYKG